MLSVAFLLQAKIQSLMWAKDDEIQTAVAHAEIQVLDAIDKQYQVRRKWQMSASTQKLVENCVRLLIKMLHVIRMQCRAYKSSGREGLLPRTWGRRYRD